MVCSVSFLHKLVAWLVSEVFGLCQYLSAECNGASNDVLLVLF